MSVLSFSYCVIKFVSSVSTNSLTGDFTLRLYRQGVTVVENVRKWFVIRVVDWMEKAITG